MSPLFMLISVFLITPSFGCGLFGGGGGGCGCGCGGRKKRSIEALPPPFTNLASKDSDMLCNSPELRETILENMKDSATESGKAISAVLERFGDHYVVICAETKFEYFVRHDIEYCGARNGSHYCQAFAV